MRRRASETGSLLVLAALMAVPAPVMTHPGRPAPTVAGGGNVSPGGEVDAASVAPDNPCYDAACGPTAPVVVEEPALGAGRTVVHPDGQTDMWAINAPEAWAITKGSSSVFVAVLDTGVASGQPQLAQKVIFFSPVCANDEPQCSSPFDNYGHGTMVAGIIAATPNDGIGIAGLGWNTKVLDIKVLNDSGQGSTPDTATGIYEAISAGARVINLSEANQPCGPNVPAKDCGPNPDEQVAIEKAIAHGVIVVAAAGNDLPSGSDQPVYPADYPGVLSVAASTDQGVVDPENGGLYEDFSNYGDDANIAAPGINVLSTWLDGDYAVESGTSFAAPHVAAAAALVIAADPKLTGPQVATLLLQSASPLAPGGATINGGLLDVGAAVQEAAAGDVPVALDGYQLIAADATAYNSGVVAAQEPQSGRRPGAPVVGGSETPGGLGYWMVTSNGAVIAVGGAHDYGPPASAHLGQPIVAMAASRDGGGYWLAGKSGAVFAFGSAHAYPAVAGPRLTKPVVGIAATPDGRGYWLVSSQGSVRAFGDAHYYGPMARIRLSKPIVGIVPTADGRGYWLVGADGGVFNFGDAGYYGSEVGRDPRQPIVGMAPSPDGHGYWLAGQNGRVWDFGSAPYEIAEPSSVPSAPIVGITS